MKHSITHYTVPRETFADAEDLMKKFRSPLEVYLDLLLWWNKRVNLVSRNVPRETVWEHIHHSLLIHKFEHFANASFVVDAGTGGGLPGIPLAITHPDKHFLLNDIVTKKVLAVRQVVQKLGLQNVAEADRSIAEIKTKDPFLLISKHAFKINDLFAMTHHLPWTEMVFYKGRDFEEELTGISSSLSIAVYDFSEGSEDSFYKDKALIIVSRQENTDEADGIDNRR